MKKSDLKELIRNSIIKELEYQDDDAALGNMYSPLYEKKKDEEEDVEITADETDTIEEPATDAPSPENPAISNADQKFLDTLEDLKNKAKEMGDKILETQINNTITYFTRQHVVKESLMENYELRRLQRIAGLIK